MKQKRSNVEQIALSAVPLDQKKSWQSIAFIWAGNVICVPALMVGGMIAANLSFVDSLIAMLIGYGIVVGYMILLGIQSAQLGLASTVSFSRAYGTRGSGLIISLIIALSMTGWFAFQTFVCGNSFSTILSTSLGIDFPVWLSCILWGAAMLVTAVYGIGFIKLLNSISVPLLFIFLIYGVVYILGQPQQVEALLNYTPAEPGSLITGIVIAVGGFAVGATISGDYTRYCKDGRSVVLSSLIGIIPAGVGALVCGAILSVTSGSYDITTMFSNIGMPVIGLVVLILATWTTNTGNAYSAGIATVNIFRLSDDKRFYTTLACGIIGILLSLGGVINVFLNFLITIGYFIPPVAGVVISDYWLLGKGYVKDWKKFEGINWLGIIAWLAGVAVAYFGKSFFIPTVNGIVVAALVYYILGKIVKSTKYNPFYHNIVKEV